MVDFLGGDGEAGGEAVVVDLHGAALADEAGEVGADGGVEIGLEFGALFELADDGGGIEEGGAGLAGEGAEEGTIGPADGEAIGIEGVEVTEELGAGGEDVRAIACFETADVLEGLGA